MKPRTFWQWVELRRLSARLTVRLETAPLCGVEWRFCWSDAAQVHVAMAYLADFHVETPAWRHQLAVTLNHLRWSLRDLRRP